MIKKRQIGNLDLYVTEIGLGTAPLGGWPIAVDEQKACLLYTSPSPRDRTRSRMPSSA